MNFKDRWFEYYEKHINDGLSEEKASALAERDTADYYDEYGDYLRDKQKDRRMMEDD